MIDSRPSYCAGLSFQGIIYILESCFVEFANIIMNE